MSKGSNRRQGVGYEENFERIFGDIKPETGNYRIERHSGELVRAAEVKPEARLHVVGDIEPFISPVTGETISSRSQLRQHNKDNGVTNIEDYGPNGGQAFFEREAHRRIQETHGATPADRADRIERLKHAIDKHRN